MKKHKHKWIFDKKLDRIHNGFYMGEFLSFICECGEIKEVKVKVKI